MKYSHPARAIAGSHKATTKDWLAERLEKVQVTRPQERAREIMLLMQGSMELVLIHGDRSYIDAAARAAKQLIKQKLSRMRDVRVGSFASRAAYSTEEMIWNLTWRQAIAPSRSGSKSRSDQ